MSEPVSRPSRHVLEPMERISEILFGLIMVLIFTRSLSVAEAGRTEVRAMLVGAVGCNLAWGIVDAVMFLMARLSERGGRLVTLRALRQAADAAEAHRLVADALPPLVASVLRRAELETIRRELQRLPEPPARARLARDDWLGAVAVFSLVFLSTFPVVIPFLVVPDAALALWLSSAIAIVMLFLAGSSFGRLAGHRPWAMGLSMVALGSALVGIARALGG